MKQLQVLLFILLLLGALQVKQVSAQPSVSITAPKSGDILAGMYTITVMAAAPNDNGIAYVEVFYQYGITPGEIGITAKAPYTFTWDTTKVDNGTYGLYAKAAANDGANGTSPTITVSVVNGVAAAPTLSSGSIGILIVILALVGIASMVIYRSQSQKRLKLPGVTTARFLVREVKRKDLR